MWDLSHGKVYPCDFSNQTVNVVESGRAGQTVVGTMYRVKLHVRILSMVNVENIFISDWHETIVRLQSHAVKILLMYCFKS